MNNVEPLHPMDEDEIALALELAPALESAGNAAQGVNIAWSDTPLAKQWARFRDQFAQAMEGSLYKVDDLELMIASGSAYFWPGKDSAVVAQRVVYPSGEAVMQTLWAVGDIDEVVRLAPGIEATARLVGCSSMLVEGHAGWARVLKAQGYDRWSVTLRKEL